MPDSGSRDTVVTDHDLDFDGGWSLRSGHIASPTGASAVLTATPFRCAGYRSVDRTSETTQDTGSD
jgi:hypothetical protein